MSMLEAGAPQKTSWMALRTTRQPCHWIPAQLNAGVEHSENQHIDDPNDSCVFDLDLANSDVQQTFQDDLQLWIQSAAKDASLFRIRGQQELETIEGVQMFGIDSRVSCDLLPPSIIGLD